MTLIFYYHWARFAPSTSMTMVVLVVYTTGVVVLLLGLLGSLSTL